MEIMELFPLNVYPFSPFKFMKLYMNVYPFSSYKFMKLYIMDIHLGDI